MHVCGMYCYILAIAKGHKAGTWSCFEDSEDVRHV